MNLRLSEDSIRVRVSREEFDTLVSDGEIAAELFLAPERPVAIKVKSVSAEAALVYSTDGDEIEVRVSNSAIVDLQERLPSKSGITVVERLADNRTIEIALEVDVKAKRS